MDIHMSIDFVDKEGDVVRTVSLDHYLPNLAVGQIMAFDHPSVERSLIGKIIRIQHVVFLRTETPLTYVDIEICDV